jgi:hypothetical protein
MLVSNRFSTRSLEAKNGFAIGAPGATDEAVSRCRELQPSWLPK